MNTIAGRLTLVTVPLIAALLVVTALGEPWAKWATIGVLGAVLVGCVIWWIVEGDGS